MTPRLAGAALAAFVMLLADPARAARPFNTDDARIVEPGGYQIESYVKDQRNQSETEFWFLPAHNFGGAFDRVEWTLGGNITHSDQLSNSNQVLFQAKTLFKPLPENGFGIALTLGVTRLKPGGLSDEVATPFGPTTVPSGAPSTESRVNPFFNLISSVSVADGQFVFHFNGGITRETEENYSQRNWGVGAEIFGLWRVYPIAEMYGLSGQKPQAQVGVRCWVIPNTWQIDGTVGRQSADPQDRVWVSLGVRILW
jgi:hypothetical protein